MTYRYRVELTCNRAGRFRAKEAHTGVDLGPVWWNQNERMWHIAWLMKPERDGISRLPSLEAVALEMERWCRANPDEIDAGYRAILAAQDRATSPEPVEPAPELQGVMPL